jgi:hypothetical protein
MRVSQNVVVAVVGATVLAAAALGCSAAGAATETSNGTSGDVPAVFTKFSSAVTISVDGDYVVLKAKGVPDHKSPYFATTDSRYEAYNGTNPNFALNPNRIIEQSYTFRIPIHPSGASTHAATPLGPIGVAINGVPLYNQYNGQNRPLSVEIDSFDQYNGHPAQAGDYHYHVEPISITRASGSSALIGFLLDGFPVYGPVENGKRLTNADLDELHGHSGATADYPQGVYHYHITDDDPYINGAGFYGTAGTVGR